MLQFQAQSEILTQNVTTLTQKVTISTVNVTILFQIVTILTKNVTILFQIAIILTGLNFNIILNLTIFTIF